jgi:hypothetical protein
MVRWGYASPGTSSADLMLRGPLRGHLSMRRSFRGDRTVKCERRSPSRILVLRCERPSPPRVLILMCERSEPRRRERGALTIAAATGQGGT